MAAKSIAVVACSTRPGRIGPFVANYVLEQIARSLATRDAISGPDAGDADADPGAATVDLLDLASQNLPLYDEPAVPSHLPASNPTSCYVHEHTRAWSTMVRKYDAFIFVTPQYNWSVPASLKNALDYLFHEWYGKPAGIVTYGHRGGVKAADHLRQILSGLRMGDVAEPTVALKLVKDAPEGGQAGMRELWRTEGEDVKIEAMFRQLLQSLS